MECLHQTGMHLQQRFCTVQNPTIQAVAQEKASSRSSHPNVIAHTNAINAGNKHSFFVVKIGDSILMHQKKAARYGAIQGNDTFLKGSKNG